MNRRPQRQQRIVVHARSDFNKAQLLSYMKLLDIPLGLIFKFNEPKLSRPIEVNPSRRQFGVSQQKRRRKQSYSSLRFLCLLLFKDFLKPISGCRELFLTGSIDVHLKLLPLVLGQELVAVE